MVFSYFDLSRPTGAMVKKMDVLYALVNLTFGARCDVCDVCVMCVRECGWEWVNICMCWRGGAGPAGYRETSCRVRGRRLGRGVRVGVGVRSEGGALWDDGGRSHLPRLPVRRCAPLALPRGGGHEDIPQGHSLLRRSGTFSFPITTNHIKSKLLKTSNVKLNTVFETSNFYLC